MVNYPKGRSSREEIIDSARQIFNEYGIQITLAKLAELIDTTLGRITHHFKNKDSLFLAITEDYEKKLEQLRQNRPSSLITMNNFINAYSQVFDLQYEYRCAMRFTIASIQHQEEMKSHLHKTYSRNREIIKQIIKTLVDAGLVQQRILKEEFYEVFLFQFTSLFTNWVINLELYDSNRSIEKLKPTYMKGIISVFLPYLTKKGTNELYENALFSGDFSEYS
jgi:AcrR family transcriptional regulator